MGLFVWLKRIYRAMFGRDITYGVHPALVVPVTVTGDAAGAFARGAYVQLVAAVAQDEWIVGVELTAPNTVDLYEVDVALGALAAEVDRITIPATSVQITAAGVRRGIYIPLPHPVFVPIGTRLAARSGNFIAAAETIDVKIVTARGM